MDFGESPNQMLKRFKAWLDLPENEKRTNAFECDPTGTTGKFKDRLKDLATWRLFDELGFDEMLKFAAANRRRFTESAERRIKDGKDSKIVKYNLGDRMPFHDARQGQSDKAPLNEAPLFTELRSASKAITQAREYLAKMISEAFDQGSKKASQISKSSS